MKTPIGAQLYIFRNQFDLQNDIELILKELAADEYDGIEGFARGYHDYRHLLDIYGLRYFGAHLTLPELEDLTTLIRYLRTMGGQDICCSGLLQWKERSLDDYRRAVPVLNETGRLLRAENIHLHYHNHDFEFEPQDDGITGMDILLDGLDFDVVSLCFDMGWAERMQIAPADFMRQHSSKIGYLHLRDFEGTRSVALGAGEIDLAPVLALLPKLPNLRHVVVEQDPTAPDPLLSMQQSREFLTDQFSL